MEKQKRRCNFAHYLQRLDGARSSGYSRYGDADFYGSCRAMMVGESSPTCIEMDQPMSIVQTARQPVCGVGPKDNHTLSTGSGLGGSCAALRLAQELA